MIKNENVERRERCIMPDYDQIPVFEVNFSLWTKKKK